jgi:outer membrane lipase/esterase
MPIHLKSALCRTAATITPLIILCGGPATAQTFIAFGDSLSDTGNAFRLTGGTYPDPQFYTRGRLSDGPIWFDRLAPNHGKLADLLLSPSAAQGQQGWNFAVAGADSGSGDLDVAAGTPPGLLAQVRQYARLSSAGSIPLAQGPTTAVLWAGANDYGSRAADPGRIAAQDQNFVRNVVGNIDQATREITQAGADEVVVLNLFGFSRAPSTQLLPVEQRRAGDAMTSAHNRELLTAVEAADNAGTGTVLLVDVHSLIDDIAARPELYGFTHISEPCLPDGEAPQCADAAAAARRVFWDGTHLTSAAHALVAQQISATRLAAEELPRQAAVAADVSLAAADAHRSLLAQHRGSAIVSGDGNWVMSMNYARNDIRRTAEPGRAGYEAQGNTFGIGLERRFDYGQTLGVLISHGDFDAQHAGVAGSTNSTANSVSGFFSQNIGALRLDVQAGQSWLDTDLTRATRFDVSPTARGGTQGTATMLDGAASYRFALGAFAFSPLAGLRWTRVSLDGWRERDGGIMNAAVSEQENTSLVGSLGLRLEWTLPLPNLQLTVFTEAGAERELLDRSWQTAVTLPSGQRLNRTFHAAALGRVSGELGVSARLKQGLTAAFSYKTAASNGGDREHTLRGTLALQF